MRLITTRKRYLEEGSEMGLFYRDDILYMDKTMHEHDKYPDPASGILMPRDRFLYDCMAVAHLSFMGTVPEAPGPGMEQRLHEAIRSISEDAVKETTSIWRKNGFDWPEESLSKNVAINRVTEYLRLIAMKRNAMMMNLLYDLKEEMSRERMIPHAGFTYEPDEDRGILGLVVPGRAVDEEALRCAIKRYMAKHRVLNEEEPSKGRKGGAE